MAQLRLLPLLSLFPSLTTLSLLDPRSPYLISNSNKLIAFQVEPDESEVPLYIPHYDIEFLATILVPLLAPHSIPSFKRRGIRLELLVARPSIIAVGNSWQAFFDRIGKLSGIPPESFGLLRERAALLLGSPRSEVLGVGEIKGPFQLPPSCRSE